MGCSSPCWSSSKVKVPEFTDFFFSCHSSRFLPQPHYPNPASRAHKNGSLKYNLYLSPPYRLFSSIKKKVSLFLLQLTWVYERLSLGSSCFVHAPVNGCILMRAQAALAGLSLSLLIAIEKGGLKLGERWDTELEELGGGSHECIWSECIV